LYTNFSIVDPNNRNPYFDTPSPKVFGNVSPMDPQLFMRINDYAAEMLNGERSGKYSPIEYAQWLEDYADAAAKHLSRAESQTEDKKRPEFRRMAIDVTIQVGLGRFFSAKCRSGVLYAIFEQTGDRTALELSLQMYRNARNFWTELANRAKDVYQHDITVGEMDYQRGHWLDRLPAIDEDIALMARKLEQTKSGGIAQQDSVRLAIQKATGRPVRASGECRHVQPEHFRAGEPLNIEISIEKSMKSVWMYYRHVNHAERFVTVEMHRIGTSYRASIPAEYTNSHYPLQYYFELKEQPDRAWLYPGFKEDLTNQPYFVVQKA